MLVRPHTKTYNSWTFLFFHAPPSPNHAAIQAFPSPPPHTHHKPPATGLSSVHFVTACQQSALQCTDDATWRHMTLYPGPRAPKVRTTWPVLGSPGSPCTSHSGHWSVRQPRAQASATLHHLINSLLWWMSHFLYLMILSESIRTHTRTYS